jgi:hypothetical protein
MVRGKTGKMPILWVVEIGYLKYLLYCMVYNRHLVNVSY